MATRSDIVSEARSYLGVTWRHQGRSRENGVDCAGMVVLVANKFDLADDRAYNNVNYPRRPDGTFVEQFRTHCTAKPTSQAANGDILIFAEGKHACHVGIRSTYHGRPAVIHSHAGMRKVVEQTLESAEGIVGKPRYCFEFQNVED